MGLKQPKSQCHIKFQMYRIRVEMMQSEEVVVVKRYVIWSFERTKMDLLIPGKSLHWAVAYRVAISLLGILTSSSLGGGFCLNGSKKCNYFFLVEGGYATKDVESETVEA